MTNCRATCSDAPKQPTQHGRLTKRIELLMLHKFGATPTEWRRHPVRGRNRLATGTRKRSVLPLLPTGYGHVRLIAPVRNRRARPELLGLLNPHATRPGPQPSWPNDGPDQSGRRAKPAGI